MLHTCIGNVWLNVRLYNAFWLDLRFTCCLVGVIRCFICDVYLIPTIIYVTHPCMIISSTCVVLLKALLVVWSYPPVFLQSSGLLRVPPDDLVVW